MKDNHVAILLEDLEGSAALPRLWLTCPEP